LGEAALGAGLEGRGEEGAGLEGFGDVVAAVVNVPACTLPAGTNTVAGTATMTTNMQPVGPRTGDQMIGDESDAA
jgi:hypothetical protein